MWKTKEIENQPSRLGNNFNQNLISVIFFHTHSNHGLIQEWSLEGERLIKIIFFPGITCVPIYIYADPAGTFSKTWQRHFFQTFWQATGSPRYTVWLRKWQHTVPPLPVKGLWNVIWATVSAIFIGAMQSNNYRLFPKIIFGKFSNISLLAKTWW